PDAVVAAGYQAASDVDPRALRAAQPGDGREPHARRGADRGAAAGGSHTRGEAGGAEARRRKIGHVGRSGLRVLLRRLSGRRLPPSSTQGSKRTTADREHAIDVILSFGSPAVAAFDADRRRADTRDRRGDYRQP